MRPTLVLASALLLVALARSAVGADAPPAPPPAPAATPKAPPELAVGRAEGLVLDGRPDEPAWAQAAVLPAGEADGVRPVVKVLASAGRLWVLVECPQAAGFASAVKGMVAPEGTATTAEAVAFAYGPQEVRAPRWVARGPRGEGRGTYRFEAAWSAAAERWTAELVVPLEDVAPGLGARDLRLALAVALRTPNVLSAAPEGGLFGAPSDYARLRAPAGGWGTGAPAGDAKALLEQDAADRRRLEAWHRFVDAQRGGRVSREKAREVLLAPLDEALAARPDLAMLHVVRGNLLRQIGERDDAHAAYERALAAVPGFREADWEMAQLEAAEWLDRPDTEPSDYAAALARVEAAAKARPDALAPRLAEGVLRYRQGEFARAAELLSALAVEVPIDDEAAGALRFSQLYPQAWSEELGYRRRDERKGDLPRVRLVTTKGAVDLELFEDDAPNTVANFLWLAKAGFYDGTVFHRAVPFYIVQGGDPNTRTGRGVPGQGGPGYTIPTEPAARTKRRPFRGVVAMANMGRKDTEGSQFFLTTGTAAHLEDSFSVFGRIVEGQSVAESLAKGDRLERVEVLRTRARDYRPTTSAGEPAPAPVDGR